MSLNARTHRYTAPELAPAILLPMPAADALQDSLDAAPPGQAAEREDADPADLPQQRPSIRA